MGFSRRIRHARTIRDAPRDGGALNGRFPPGGSWVGGSRQIEMGIKMERRACDPEKSKTRKSHARWSRTATDVRTASHPGHIKTLHFDVSRLDPIDLRQLASPAFSRVSGTAFADAASYAATPSEIV